MATKSRTAVFSEHPRHAPSPAADREVVPLVQEDRLECADGLLEVRDPLEAALGIRQIQPEAPLLAEALHRFVGLPHGPERVVVTDRHALHAALAGVGVHRDAHEPAGAGGLLLVERPVRAGQGEAEAVEVLGEPLQFLSERLSILGGGLGRHPLQRATQQSPHIGALAGFGERPPPVPLGLAHGPGEVGELAVASPNALHHRVEHLHGLVDQAGDRGVRAHGVAVPARGAVLGHPLGVLEADARHVAEGAAHRRHHAEPDERVGDVVVAHAAGVEIARLLPEPVDIGGRSIGAGLPARA